MHEKYFTHLQTILTNKGTVLFIYFVILLRATCASYLCVLYVLSTCA